MVQRGMGHQLRGPNGGGGVVLAPEAVLDQRAEGDRAEVRALAQAFQRGAGFRGEGGIGGAEAQRGQVKPVQLVGRLEPGGGLEMSLCGVQLVQPDGQLGRDQLKGRQVCGPGAQVIQDLRRQGIRRALESQRGGGQQQAVFHGGRNVGDAPAPVQQRGRAGPLRQTRHELAGDQVRRIEREDLANAERAVGEVVFGQERLGLREQPPLLPVSVGGPAPPDSRANQQQEGEGHEGQPDSAFHDVVHAREWSIIGRFCQTSTSMSRSVWSARSLLPLFHRPHPSRQRQQAGRTPNAARQTLAAGERSKVWVSLALALT